MIAAFTTAIYSYVFLTFIDPSYLERIIAQALEETETKMLEQGLSEEQIEPGLAMTRKFMSPAMMSTFSVLGSALFGAILSLLAAAFLKKEDKSFNGQFKDVQ
jgi:predicted membrane protein